MGVVLYHVTVAVNRASIARHGLDWRRMGAAEGIAGSVELECEGVFLARDADEADWFAAMPVRRGLDVDIDVWEVSLDVELDSYGDPIGDGPLVEVDGFLCHRGPIGPDRLRLRRA